MFPLPHPAFACHLQLFSFSSLSSPRARTLSINRGNRCNSNSRDVSLLSSVLCAGLYPNVAMRRPGGTNFKTLGGHTARVSV